MAVAKKKKRFFDVEIPLIGKTTQLQAFGIEELKDRHIKYDLTRSLRGKSITLQAVVDVKKDEATASPKKLTLMPYFLKRMVRKGTNYVEDSFSTEAKDSQIKIKPFLITRRKVSRAVRKALREKAKKEIISYVKTKTTNEIFEDILENTLQKSLSLKLKKIYPLSTCEIRVIRVEGEPLKKVPKAKEETKEEAEEKKEKKE
jgi:ribosomal protein S3AE